MADEWAGLVVTSNRELSEKLIETAELAYKILIKKRFYAEAKMFLLAQIYKILAQKIKKYTWNKNDIDALLLLCFSERGWWAVIAGDLMLFQVRLGQLISLPVKNVAHLIPPFETQLGLFFPQPYEGNFVRGDIFIALSQSVLQAVSRKKIVDKVEKGTREKQTVEVIAKQILEEVIKRRKSASHCVNVLQRS